MKYLSIYIKKHEILKAIHSHSKAGSLLMKFIILHYNKLKLFVFDRPTISIPTLYRMKEYY